MSELPHSPEEIEKIKSLTEEFWKDADQLTNLSKDFGYKYRDAIDGFNICIRNFEITFTLNMPNLRKPPGGQVR